MRFLQNFRIPLFILLLIVVEVIFKFSAFVGFFFYLAALMGGLVFVILRFERFLTVLLVLPLIRVVGISVPLDSDTKLLFNSAVLLMLVILVCDRFSLGLQRKKIEAYFIAGSIVGGGLMGLFLSSHVAPWATPVVYAGLLLSAVGEEWFFRLALLSYQKTIGMLIMVSVLYAVVVFDASFVVSLAAFVFSFLGGYVYLRWHRAYVPVLAHIALNFFLVFPIFFG